VDLTSAFFISLLLRHIGLVAVFMGTSPAHFHIDYRSGGSRCHSKPSLYDGYIIHKLPPMKKEIFCSLQENLKLNSAISTKNWRKSNLDKLIIFLKF
jgi:hypothetical protein